MKAPYDRWLLGAIMFIIVLAWWGYEDHQAEKCQAQGGKYVYRLALCTAPPPGEAK